MDKFREIDSWRAHLRTVLEEWDYIGPDENGDPIYKHEEKYPVIYYTGTHKIGGANTSIRWCNGGVEFQTRNKVLGDGEDFHGFKRFCEDFDIPRLLMTRLKMCYQITSPFNVTLYGEWCGAGVQDKHSISTLEDNVWIVFALKIDGVYFYLDNSISSEEMGVFNIRKWGLKMFTIDFSQYSFGDWEKPAPELVLNEIETATVPCPVSAHFRINGIGEGMVLTSVSKSLRTGNSFVVKLKNSRYDTKTAVTTKKNKVQNPAVQEFLDKTITRPRLVQMMNELINNDLTVEMKNIKVFQDMVIADVIKEHQKDMADLNLTAEDWVSASRHISTSYFVHIKNNGK